MITAYYSTKEKGTELGIFASYDMVESLNGKINVSSEVCVGITFPLSFHKK